MRNIQVRQSRHYSFWRTLGSKPDDVYCKLADEAASVARKNSPQYRLVEWITGPEVKEIYAAYLSFSSKNIVSAMCSALKSGVKIKMVLDGGEGYEVSPNKDAEGLKNVVILVSPTGEVQVVSATLITKFF